MQILFGKIAAWHELENKQTEKHDKHNAEVIEVVNRN